MKDFVQFWLLITIAFAIGVAIPVAGFVIGVGFGTWFLWKAFKEERNDSRKQ
jgi:hypothetical protein